MGMFDYITCEAKLPKIPNPMELKGFDFNKLTFQTKDIYNAFAQYRITADKKLQLRDAILEHVPGDPKSKSVIYRIGHMKEVSSSWKDLHDFTGSFDFYDSIRFQDNLELENDYWVEYTAKVIDGKVKSIRLKAFTHENNAESRAQNEAFEKRMENERVFWTKWYSRFLIKPYYDVVSGVFRYWRKLSDKLPRSHRVENFFKPF